MNTINNNITARSAITRDEQIVALKATAKEYHSVSSVTATRTHVIVVMDNTTEAGELVTLIRHNGWWNATMSSGQLSQKWFVRVLLND